MFVEEFEGHGKARTLDFRNCGGKEVRRERIFLCLNEQYSKVRAHNFQYEAVNFLNLNGGVYIYRKKLE